MSKKLFADTKLDLVNEIAAVEDPVMYDQALSLRFEHEAEMGKSGHIDKESRDFWKQYLSDAKVSEFMNAAYESPDGYSIRVNPLTGKKEMFIAGTRSRGGDFAIRDWLQNAAEGIHHAPLLEEGVDSFFGEGTFEGLDVIGSWSEAQRDKGSARYSEIAKDNGVEVVYGHSRGAAVMSGMKGGFIKVGLDGASAIGHDDEYVNIVQRWGLFDRAIGLGHKGNIGVGGRKFHDVTQSKGGDKKKRNKEVTTVVKKVKKKPVADKKRPKTDTVSLPPSKRPTKRTRVSVSSDKKQHARPKGSRKDYTPTGSGKRRKRSHSRKRKR